MKTRCKSVCLGRLSRTSPRCHRPRPSKKSPTLYLQISAPLTDTCCNFIAFLEETVRFFQEYQTLIASEIDLLEKIRLFYDRLDMIQSITDTFKAELKRIIGLVQRDNETPSPETPTQDVKKRRINMSVLKRESPDTLTNDDLLSFGSGSDMEGVSGEIFRSGSISGIELERKLAEEELMPVKIESDSDSIYSKQTDHIDEIVGGASIGTLPLDQAEEEGVAGPEEFKMETEDFHRNTNSLNVSVNDDCHLSDFSTSVKSSTFSYRTSRLQASDNGTNPPEETGRALEATNSKRGSQSGSSLGTNQKGGASTDVDEEGGATHQTTFGKEDLELLEAMSATSSDLSQDVSSKSSTSSSEDEEKLAGNDEKNAKTSKREEELQIRKDCTVRLERDPVERLLDLTSLERKRRRSLSTNGTARNPNPTKRPRPPTSDHSLPSTDPDSEPSPDSPLDDLDEIETALHQSEPELDREQDADRSLLENIVQSSNDEEVSEDEEAGPKPGGASRVKKVVKRRDRAVSAWRRDKLLTSKLTSDSSSEDERKDDFKEEVKVEEINIEDDDSDVVIVNDVAVKEEEEVERKTVRRKHRREERDDDTTDSDTSDAKPKAAGRRNIRTLLSDEKLTAATREANLRENLRLQRLEQKQRRLDSNLSQISEPDRLVLDATEGSIIAVHPVLSRRLKEHQVNGVKFMWNACYESVDVLKTEPGAGCILAHCMGLGKTFQVVTLVHTLFTHPVTNTQHVLVICPLSTVLNWQNEFNIGFGLTNSKQDINVFIISDQKDRLSKVNVVKQWRKQSGVLIMGYDCYTILTQRSKSLKSKLTFDNTSLESIAGALVDPGPDLVICDEGHRLKNSNTNCTKALMGIKTLRRIILTGTPLQNNLFEYYSMVQFVKPDLLGTVKEFRNRFENPITNGQYGDSTLSDIKLMKKRSHVLHSILKDTVQRYEVTELQHYLPEKKEYVVFVTLHPVQAALYQIYIDHFKANRQTQFLSHFHLLQSTWTHPQLLYTKDKMAVDKKKDKNEVETIVIDDVNEEQTKALDLPVGWWRDYVPQDYHHNLDYGPKLKVMIAIVKESIRLKEKVLIFSSSIAVLDLIQQVLTSEFVGWRICRDFLRMDGTVAPEQRQKFCNMFNQPDHDKNRVFLISHKVGGLGLNLVAANRVILMDVCWNPAIDTQSIFRVYRFGQTRPCYIYRLVSKSTMEEVAYKRSVTKQAISGRVVDEMQINRHYSLEDLREMYNFDYRPDQERPTPKLPTDGLLARVIQDLKTEVFSYHEHESLLVNMPEEELDPEDIKLAWDEFNREKDCNKEPEFVQEIVYPTGYKDLTNATIQNLSTVLSDHWLAASRRKTRPEISQESAGLHSYLAPFHSNGVVYNAEEAATPQIDKPRQIVHPMGSTVQNHPARQTPATLQESANPALPPAAQTDKPTHLAGKKRFLYVLKRVTPPLSDPAHSKDPTSRPVNENLATLRVFRVTKSDIPLKTIVPFRLVDGKVKLATPQPGRLRLRFAKNESGSNLAKSQSDSIKSFSVEEDGFGGLATSGNCDVGVATSQDSVIGRPVLPSDAALNVATSRPGQIKTNLRKFATS